MSTPLAAVILAHADPEHLARLVGALDDVPVVVHCDARTPDQVFARMSAAAPQRVTFIPRRRTTLASWSLVQAELDALAVALRRTNARHIAVLSGADYPLMAVSELVHALEPWAGRTWMANSPLPNPEWNTRRHPDGGLWRLRYRFLTTGDHQVVFWRGLPLRVPIPRGVPADLELRAGSQWKIYAREHVTALLKIVDQRPDLMRFWRTTLVPDEVFAPSMLGSRKLFGGDAMTFCPSGPWYIDWDNEHSGHPRWLSENDFDRLKVARWATPVDPADDRAEEAGQRNLFARKFRTSDPSILDRIDAELRR